MKRLACFSLLVLPLALAFAPSCKVGDHSELQEGVESDATAEVIDGGDVPEADALAGGDPNCEEEALANGAGQHRPGASCIAGGCHDGGDADAPLWTLAGTAYTDIDGLTPMAGGTIIVVDADAVEHKLITALNGNFYTALPIAFPVQVKGSRCPNTMAMSAAVDVNMASCNTSGCHNAAGNRIYVPE